MSDSNVEFGVVLHTRHYIRDGSEDTDFEGFFQEVEGAERAGFDHVWIGDMPHIGMEDRAHGDALTTLAAMAARTRTLKVGVVPLVAALRNPVVLAQALATLDRIASGRLVLGMSIGSAGRWGASAELEFDASDAVFNQRAGRLSECIEVMRRLWTAEEPFAFDGKYYHFQALAIQPRPMHKRAIPIYLTGVAEPAMRRVARLADGWFTTFKTLDEFTERKAVMDGLIRGYGRDPSEVDIALQVAFHLDEDGDRARERGAASIAGYTSNQPLSEISPFFGSPEEVANNIRPLLDLNLKAIVARLVSNDLASQGKLIGQLREHLAKAPA